MAFISDNVYFAREPMTTTTLINLAINRDQARFGTTVITKDNNNLIEIYRLNSGVFSGIAA